MRSLLLARARLLPTACLALAACSSEADVAAPNPGGGVPASSEPTSPAPATSPPGEGETPAAEQPSAEAPSQGPSSPSEAPAGAMLGEEEAQPASGGEEASETDPEGQEPAAEGEEAPAEPEPEPQEESEPAEAPSAFEPSAGCSSGGGTEGEFTLGLPGGPAAYTVGFPPGYDGATPVPLVFGFHGRGRTHIQFRTVDAGQIQSTVEPQALVIYPKSQNGNGWNFAAEVPPNVEFFERLYDVALNQYCVDTSRIFAIGHSSGGYFSNILACRFGDRLRGIAAIAGNNQESNCTGQVAALIIHGVRDAVVSFQGGQQSRNEYMAANGCSNQSQPANVSPCIAYQGCQAGLPVQWCEHNEPTYENTNHGWPSFASRAVADFLFSLPQ